MTGDVGRWWISPPLGEAYSPREDFFLNVEVKWIYLVHFYLIHTNRFKLRARAFQVQNRFFGLAPAVFTPPRVRLVLRHRLRHDVTVYVR